MPIVRRGYIDVLRAGQRKRFIHALFDVDVTQLRRDLAARHDDDGCAVSFTAVVAHAVGASVDADKLLHAQRRGSTLILFDDVDISTQIEISEGDDLIVKPHVIRAANRKSLRTIHTEIRAAQHDNDPEGEARRLRAMKAFLHLPRPVRAPAWWAIQRQPRLFKELGGTVGLSAVGMFAPNGSWGVPISFPTLMVTVGGIDRRPGFVGERVEPREYLSLTVTVDHDIVDGAPAARFASRLADHLATGRSLVSW